MNPDRDDEKLESYLRQFHARAPRPLVLHQPRRLFRPLAVIAATAAALLIALVFLFPGWRRQGAQTFVVPEAGPIAKEISFARLSRFARQSPDKLEEHLNELSARTLPDVRAGQGVLKRLARE